MLPDLLDTARPFDAPVQGGLVVLPAFDPAERRLELAVPAGSSVLDAVRLALPGMPPEQHARLRVTIGDDVVPHEMWDRVRPKLWSVVLIRVVPGAGELFRSVLLLAVTVAAVATGQYYLGPMLASAIVPFGVPTAFTSALVSGAVTGTLLLGGSLLVNTLVPVRKADDSVGKAAYAINGFQNVPNSDGPVPQLFGAMRIAPQYAGLPYGVIEDDQRWIVASFLIGQGPVDLAGADPAIGLTPLSNFDSTEYEITLREGYASDAALPNYTMQVIEESLSIAVRYDEDAPVRLTASDCTEIEVEAFYTGGLFHIENDGDIIPWTNYVVVEVNNLASPGFVTLDPIITTKMTRTPFFVSGRYVLPERGQYEVKVTRNAADDGEASQQTAWSWTALRSFRPEYPLSYDKPMALAEVKLRSSGRLNGALDAFNLWARRICPDWDAGTQTWITRVTNNPASIARLVLQGPQNTWPEPDSALDLEAFQEWHEYCADKGLTYNAWITADITRDDALADVCSAGRAFPYRRGDRWSVVVDRPRTVFFDHISARNSWGLKEIDPPVAFPDAYTVRFLDQTNNYAEARRVVPWPGFDGDPVVVEELTMAGKTDPAEVWRETRRRQYEAIYRRRSWTVSQDAEHLAIGRGEAAFLSHPVIDRRHAAGRVTAVSGSIVSLDEIVELDDGLTYTARFRTAAGETITRPVLGHGGGSRSLLLGGGAAPAVGDLVTVYTTAAPAIEVIVKSIERGEHHTGQLTLVAHAPEIDTLTDAEVAPAWDGRVGEILT